MPQSELIVKKRINWAVLPQSHKDLFSLNYCKAGKLWEWLEWDHNLSSYDMKGYLKSNDTSLDVVNDDPD